MPKYKYKTVKNGLEIENQIESKDKATLYKNIIKEGGAVVSISEINESKKDSFFTFKQIKNEDKINFAKNLSVMIDAGLSVSRAIAILQKQSTNKKLSSLFEQIVLSVNSGNTFSKSLEMFPKIFPELFVSMVKAGEESGQLASSLKIVAEQLEKSNNLTKKIKGAMIYPAIIIFIMIIIGFVLMVYMVPMLTETFKGLNINLPLPTRIIISISDFMINNIIYCLGGLILFIFSFAYVLKTKKGKYFIDYLVLKMPIISNISKQVNTARTARTLASLISSGVSIVSAIEITSKVVQNHYFRDVLLNASKKIETGDQLSSVLSQNSNLYPIFISEMLAVGEETGKLTDMLLNTANYYESEVDQKTKDLSTIIEPFLMVFIGIAVGLFAVAMMLPTYSLVDAIK